MSLCNERIGHLSGILHLYVSFGLYEVFVKNVWSLKSKISNSNCELWYYLTFILMSLLMFIVSLVMTKKCYKYRKKVEDIHNRQMFALNYYEKYLPHLA